MPVGSKIEEKRYGVANMRTIAKTLLYALLVLAVGTAGFGFYLTRTGVDPVVKPDRQMSEIWADFPFESHYVAVKGSRMHYIDEGDPDGPVFLLLHGNPTSSYLWRKVIPHLAGTGGRVIAVDNIGFGGSDRPDISYTFLEHTEYLDGFIRQLQLKDITLVLHDWGSGLGFDYAARNQDNVAGIAFMEAILDVPSSDRMDASSNLLFGAMRSHGSGEIMVLAGNFFVEQLIPRTVVRELKNSEMDAYREPFPSFGSRWPTLVWPREIPFDGEPDAVAERVSAYAQWLRKTSVPKLLLYFTPGTLIKKATAERISKEWTNLDAEFLGDGIHFVQEDKGPEIGVAIATWHQKRQAEGQPSGT